ncbi:RagB/SusD family nutrient uptake outer membrane protein [Bacteroides muris (ex Fokt et al. 2023)]|uniref:RagB/SusD family nutrient uptake outer membrane protein n=1 Tax=Bacteroides muris (ex Fokt et al. 2023) TaxID=2937417 RepID=A0A9X2NSD9_9BACE|nr:RagB/SusD family nutrient uptake outer membrane protein [Bacteroides muris (ex Fokt et al. 2023)]MCR6505371.1 RagB/SusD family nutrient uptake outer membrane protein [Bacteroides muris (ex Fokt et al. 2023)]
MKKILAIALVAATALTSCDIERLPYGSMSAEQITSDPSASLDALMNGVYAQLKTWSDPMHRCGEYAGDNMMIRGSSTDAFFEFISYSRTPNNYRLQNFWDYGYKGIAQASNIINMIEEGQGEEIDNQLGECYYVRGMLYFYFVRAYGRPYYQAPEKNLGVPIVNGTPDNIMTDLFMEDRATVKETYEQVISDLKKAEEMLTIDKGPAYASKGAAQAMLSRVYLYMSGTYENPNQEYARLAVEYADKVINSGDYSLLNRDQFMKYNTLTPENNDESIFVVKRVASEFSGYDHYYGIGGMYANIGGMGWGEMYASAKYIDLLNETGRNDWRPDHYRIVDARAAFIEPTYEDGNKLVFRFIKKEQEKGSDPILNYAQFDAERNGATVTCKDAEKNSYTLTPVNEEEEIYEINYGGATYQGVLDYYISLNRVYPQFYITKCSREGEDSHLHSPIISRLGEIYLNRAEAYAKLGQYSQALTDLNTIRERSIPGAGYTSLDKEDAAEKIDKERQLELAYQAERSYDVFRNGKPLTRRFPGPHKQFEDVSATDYRVTYYIPQDAINAYPGTLTQNPTDNSGVVLN